MTATLFGAAPAQTRPAGAESPHSRIPEGQAADRLASPTHRKRVLGPEILRVLRWSTIIRDSAFWKKRNNEREDEKSVQRERRNENKTGET